MYHTLTIFLAINPYCESIFDADILLRDQAEKLAFLNPKTFLYERIESYDDYQNFCKAKLPDLFNTDFVLIIQMDGKILNPLAWTNDFFNYDYIGAPWKNNNKSITNILRKKNRNCFNKDLYIGNGGFSLRSKRFCQFVKENTIDAYCEDVYASVILRDKLEKAGMKFAPYDIAKKFSVENDIYVGQFGAHRSIIDNYGNKLMVKDL